MKVYICDVISIYDLKYILNVELLRRFRMKTGTHNMYVIVVVGGWGGHDESQLYVAIHYRYV